jgi:LmbE family N-acetylglucosaminyl deacetylase
MLQKLDFDGSLLILSPHLDDGVLSVGGLIDRAIKRGIGVVVGTILTRDAPQDVASSPTVQQLHSRWGLGPNPYLVRRQEDIAAVQSLGAEIIHAGLLDSIYRTDAKGNFLYPDPTSRFSEPSANDQIRNPLRELLAEWINSVKPTCILSPLGVGRHVDHKLTSDALRELSASKDLKVFLYEDMPYSAGFYPPHSPDTVLAATSRSSWTIGAPATIAVDPERKVAAVMKYKSQIKNIFPGDRDVAEELKRYMLVESNRGSQERVWSVR